MPTTEKTYTLTLDPAELWHLGDCFGRSAASSQTSRNAPCAPAFGAGSMLCWIPMEASRPMAEYERPDPMTVGQLREVLSAFDDAAPVMVQGYEGGWDYPEKVQIIDVYSRNTAWYYGRFEEPDGDPEGKDVIKVVGIPR